MGRSDNVDSTTLQRILTQEALVSSTDEASAIIESIIQDNNFNFESEDGESSGAASQERFYRHVLREYFGLDYNDVTRILTKIQNDTNCNESCVDDDEGSEEVSTEYVADHDDDDVDDDREEVIGPGECELCERDVAKLTRHHLIPKSTWKRMESMILSRWNRVVAESSKVPTKRNPSVATDSDELEHLIPIVLEMAATVPTCTTLYGRQAAAGRRIIRDLLNNQTIDICRPCHNHIHRSYDNRTLALQFNTLDKLLNDPTILKYARWASRQHRFKMR
jgi:hypothetical protein